MGRLRKKEGKSGICRVKKMTFGLQKTSQMLTQQFQQ